jgi:hypothetical protein
MRSAIVVMLFTACGAAAGGAPADIVPATDRDPLHHTPPAVSAGPAGAPIGLTAGGGEDQARQMLPAFITAVRDADEAALDRMLEAEVARVTNADQRPHPRAQLVQIILAYARRATIPAELRVEDLVDLANVRVSRAAHFFEERRMPASVRPSDVVVEAPLLPEGRAPLAAMLRWNARGYLVVRPGRDPRIVAL